MANPKDPTLIKVIVGTAGIGRMHFKAWLPDEPVDRQDGSDYETFETPGEALADAGRRLDIRMTRLGWHVCT
jgi:hypothetical protein